MTVTWTCGLFSSTSAASKPRTNNDHVATEQVKIGQSMISDRVTTVNVTKRTAYEIANIAVRYVSTGFANELKQRVYDNFYQAPRDSTSHRTYELALKNASHLPATRISRPPGSCATKTWMWLMYCCMKHEHTRYGL